MGGLSPICGFCREKGDCPHLAIAKRTPTGWGEGGNYCVFGSLSWPGIGSLAGMFSGPSE